MGKKFKFKSQKPKEKWKIFDCSEIAGKPGQLKEPRLELNGNREITVEGCGGVLEYSDSYLKIKLPKGSLTVCGTAFDIVSFAGETITVRGRMSSLEFCV